MLIVMAYFTALLFYIFYIHGGPIQKVVLEKTGTRYARSATIINVIYAAVLYYFKELNDLPMSTTWVFVGLLCGRELAISTMNKDYKFKYVFPLIGKDFVKMFFGFKCFGSNSASNSLLYISKKDYINNQDYFFFWRSS